MKYARIIAAVCGDYWMIEPSKFQAILDFLDLQSRGVKFSPPEIAARIGGEQARAIKRQSGAVAIVPIHGVIAPRVQMMDDISGPRGTSAEQIMRGVIEARDDPKIKAIVLDVESPGGSVHLIQEAADIIYQTREAKPIIAQVNARAASAAYYLASQASEIVITPSGVAGSIGVVAAHEDTSKMDEQDGVKVTLISAGKYKTEANQYEPLTEEARAAVQSAVDHYYAMFIDAVARGRGVTADAVRSGFGEGRMLPAPAAVKAGLADRIDAMPGTLSRYASRSRTIPYARLSREISMR